MPVKGILDKCSSINGAFSVPECEALTERLIMEEREAFLDRYIDKGPSISTETTDLSRMVPYTFRVLRRQANGQLIFRHPEQGRKDVGGILAGSVAIAIPRTISLPYPEILAGASDLSAFAAGGLLMVIGGLNSAMPNVQSQNFDVIIEAQPIEIGTFTVLVPARSANVKVHTSHEIALDASSKAEESPEAEPQMAGGPVDPDNDHRKTEDEILKENAVAARVVTADNLTLLRGNSFKYVLVRRSDGVEELRVAEDFYQHPQLVLTSRGERVVAAGFVSASSKSIRFDGASTNFPTQTFQVSCGNREMLARFPDITAEHRVGLNRVVEHLEPLAAQHGLAVRISDF